MEIVKKINTKDNKFGIELIKFGMGDDFFKEWLNAHLVNILTLDGSYGGRNGSEFKFLSADLNAQDDYHIGKFYDAQSYVRMPIVIYYDNDKIAMREAVDNELQNAYLTISKKDIRLMSVNLKRAKSSEIIEIANKIFSKFIRLFNYAGDNNVYKFYFYRNNNNNICEMYKVEDFYCDVMNEENQSLVKEDVLCNIPFNEKEFDVLIESLLTFNE